MRTDCFVFYNCPGFLAKVPLSVVMNRGKVRLLAEELFFHATPVMLQSRAIPPAFLAGFIGG
jgi:hypothetical protein